MFLADGGAVLVLIAGPDRVDEAKLRAVLGASVVRRANANEARAATGYPIGGVPPFGLDRSIRVVVDRGLLRHDALWAGAGTGEAVVRIWTRDLVRASGGELADVAVR